MLHALRQETGPERIAPKTGRKPSANAAMAPAEFIPSAETIFWSQDIAFSSCLMNALGCRKNHTYVLH
jgi:hypothetical protein